MSQKWNPKPDKSTDRSIEKPSRHGTFDSVRDIIGDLDKIIDTEIHNQQGDWPEPPSTPIQKQD